MARYVNWKKTTRPDTRPPVADGWAGEDMRVLSLFDSITSTDQPTNPGSDKIFRCLRAKNFYWSLPTKLAYDFRIIAIAKKFDSNMQYINQMNFVGRNHIKNLIVFSGLKKRYCELQKSFTSDDLNQRLYIYVSFALFFHQ